MARYPGAVWRPLGPITDEPKLTRKHKLVFHTMVGSLEGTDRYFREGGFSGTESHFGVGDGRDSYRDGAVFQWQDTDRQADAQLDGNDDCISVETADHYPTGWANGSDVPAWTDAQLDALVDLAVWVCRTYDIPPVLIEETKDSNRGLTYHRAGIDPWRKAGCERYSTSYGKVCPGDRRVRQLRKIIVPRVKARLESGDDDMTKDELLDALGSKRGQQIIRKAVAGELAEFRKTIDDHVSGQVLWRADLYPKKKKNLNVRNALLKLLRRSEGSEQK